MSSTMIHSSWYHRHANSYDNHEPLYSVSDEL